VTWQSDLRDAIGAALSLSEFKVVVGSTGQKWAAYDGMSFPNAQSAVVEDAERQGWVRELVAQLLAAVPGNSTLQRFRADHASLSPPALKETDVGALRTGIEAAYPTYEQLDSLLDREFKVRLDVITNRGVEPQANDYALRAIKWFDDRGQARKFIDALLATSKEPVLQSKAKAVAEGLALREAATGFRQPDAHDACLVHRRVFIDRDPLRLALPALVPVPERPIIAVHGPARSGRSYSLELVRYFAAQQQGVEVVHVDLVNEAHAKFDPRAFALSLAIDMGYADRVQFIPTLEQSGSAARWVTHLCGFIVGELRRTMRTWIIALDGFDHPDLPEPTRDMVRELARRAAAPDSRLRVVLLNYTPGLLPKDLRRRVSMEEIVNVTDVMLDAFLTRLLGQVGIAHSPELIQNVIADVNQKAPNWDIESVANVVQDWVDGIVP